MVATALFSRIAYPKLYSAAAGNPSMNAAISGGTIPKFIFPALSLDAITGVAATSAPSSVDLAGSGGAVADNATVRSDSSGASVAAEGPAGDSAFSRVGSADPPSLAVEASLVADLTTGTRFMEENATERWSLASVTKLMTATVVLDKLSPAQKITITQDAFNVDPAEKNLRVGDTYTTTDLLQFLLLPSSNVAAEALADAYGRDNFMAEMNARAAAWGMTNTYYRDPSGLDAANQSTASDLMLLAQKIYSDYPKILAITRMPQVTVTEISSGQRVVVFSWRQDGLYRSSGRKPPFDLLGRRTSYCRDRAWHG